VSGVGADAAIDARLALARSVGAEAGALALRFWLRRGELAIEAKASLQDIVSEADRAVERLSATAWRRRIPRTGSSARNTG